MSALMVAEIRLRASNQSTETASKAIASFLEIENCEESSNGWMLLSTLNLLAATNQPSLIKVCSMLNNFASFVDFIFILFVDNGISISSINISKMFVSFF